MLTLVSYCTVLRTEQELNQSPPPSSAVRRQLGATSSEINSDLYGKDLSVMEGRNPLI